MGALLGSSFIDIGNGVHLHWCEGCKRRHQVTVVSPGHTGLVKHSTFVGVCEYEINGDLITYSANCAHYLRGQTVPLRVLATCSS